MPAARATSEERAENLLMSYADSPPEAKKSAISDVVTFRPLGGLGEIGMNSFALEDGGKLLVVDCGATFPDDDVGIDLVVPDFSFLWGRQKDIVGLFITHGHEDHIGAIPHFLGGLSVKVPIFAPPHAAALIADRLAEHGIFDVELCVVRAGETYQVGSFDVEPIAVAHSIVDTTALSIRTSVGRIVHTADFNLDPEQPVGHLTDADRLAALGHEGVRLLLSDSTNIDSPSRPHSEGEVARTLVDLIDSQSERVVLAMFSSNGHRMQAAIDAAVSSGRRVCLLGKSLVRHLRVARSLGYIRCPDGLLVAPENLAELPRGQTLILAGGSQGEATSSLRRLSLGQHASLALEAGDVVIHSARVIPGNEKPVFTMLGDFMRAGVEVITRYQEPGVHTSGHAAADELRQMLEWTRPEAFIPLHGTLHHMRAHERLARATGVQNTCVVENGAPVLIPPSGPLSLGEAAPPSVVRISLGGEVLGSRARRRRTDLGRRGAIVVSALVDERGNPGKTPVVTSSGVAGIDDDEDALNVLRSTTIEALHRAKSQRMSSREEVVQRALRSVVVEMCGERPLLVVHVLVEGQGVSSD